MRTAHRPHHPHRHALMTAVVDADAKAAANQVAADQQNDD
jgi:hypothetical protein